MNKWEIYEDSAGGLYLCIIDSEGDCVAIYNDYEYAADPGVLLDAIAELEKDPDAHKWWDNNLINTMLDTLGDNEGEISLNAIRSDLGTMIADSSGWKSETMGASGRKALNYPI